MADNKHLFIIGESSVFDYLMDKILHLEEDAEIAVATQILEKLAQQSTKMIFETFSLLIVESIIFF